MSDAMKIMCLFLLGLIFLGLGQLGWNYLDKLGGFQPALAVSSGMFIGLGVCLIFGSIAWCIVGLIKKEKKSK